MNKLQVIIFNWVAPALLSAIGLSVSAQKLPNIQQTNLRAPAEIKIDGKATEWDNKFQAYNHATDIFYSISNDDNNLYLTVQAIDPVVINKIIGGGITLTIQNSGKKTDKDGMSITYPVFDKKSRPYVHSSQIIGNSVLTVSGGDVTIMPRTSMEGGRTAAPADPKEFQGDSIMNIYNKRLNSNSKYIGITGIKGLDSLISVYNTNGIKTAELFDNKIVYTYELAVSLNQLGLSVSNGTKFAYHITINGSSIFTLPDVAITTNQTDVAVKTVTPEGGGGLRVAALMGQSAPTDFWGEYTLAKK
jgi:hypothetical protein